MRGDGFERKPAQNCGSSCRLKYVSGLRLKRRFAARMGRIVRANPSITARSSEVRYQLDVLNEWTKARKDLKARYKAEMKALDDENIAKLRGGRR